MTKPDALRHWLRGKQFHPADIAVSLAWYDAQVQAGRQPTDSEVLAQAEITHDNAVGSYRSITPTPLQITHTHPPVRWVWPILVGLVSGATVEGLRWLASALMP